MNLTDILSPLKNYLNEVDFNPKGLAKALRFTATKVEARRRQLLDLRDALNRAARAADKGYDVVDQARRTEHWEETKAQWQADKAAQLLELLKEYTE
jgi:hypothetical protein